MAKKDARKITVTATSTTVRKPSTKTLKPGSMASNAKLVPDNLAKKKASTAYSPLPMTAAAKKKAALRGAVMGAKANNPMGMKMMNLDTRGLKKANLDKKVKKK